MEKTNKNHVAENDKMDCNVESISKKLDYSLKNIIPKNPGIVE